MCGGNRCQRSVIDLMSVNPTWLGGGATMKYDEFLCCHIWDGRFETFLKYDNWVSVITWDADSFTQIKITHKTFKLGCQILRFISGYYCTLEQFTFNDAKMTFTHSLMISYVILYAHV